MVSPLDKINSIFYAKIMEAINNYWLFLISAVTLVVTPGTDTIYIISRSVAQGRKAGIFSVMGVITGVGVHTILIISGLSLS